MKKDTVTNFLSMALVLLVLLPIEVSAQSNAYKCFPNYECGPWQECVDDIQFRTCEDTKCGRRSITERRFCGRVSPGCIPKIECLQWSECVYTEKVSDLIKGAISFGGYHTRLCRDAHDCVESFSEERACKDTFELELEKILECDEEFLAAIDQRSGRRVAKISLDSWRENALDVVFTQGATVCPACYNGIQDGNEQGVDCGGDCKECRKKSASLLPFAIILLWLSSAFFSLLFVKEIFLLRKIG